MDYNNADSWYTTMAAKVPIPNTHDEDDDDTIAAEDDAMIFVGSLSAAESLEFIKLYKITHILTVAANLPVNIPINTENDNGNIKKVRHLVAECHDHPMENILDVLPKCLAFIQNGLQSGNSGSRGRVLVHCASGVSRSVAVCAAYLMVQYNLKASDAIASIASVRKYANPNMGFKRQLAVLERCGGDIEAAQDAFRKVQSNVVEDTIRQREIVNELHAKADVLEERLATMTSSHNKGNAQAAYVGGVEMKSINTSLVLLETELDSCLSTDNDALVDPPARMVRKSAVAKVQRLLLSLV